MVEPLVDDTAATDVRFERAVIEALHADALHARDAPDEAAPHPEDPVERRIREWTHDVRKWSIVHRAARSW